MEFLTIELGIIAAIVGVIGSIPGYYFGRRSVVLDQFPIFRASRVEREVVMIGVLDAILDQLVALNTRLEKEHPNEVIVGSEISSTEEKQ